MTTLACAPLLLAAVLAAPAQSSPAAPAAAGAVAKRLADSMGGRAAWDALPGLAFDFVLKSDGKETFRRSHLWDKRKSRHRLEMTSPDGKRVVVVHSVLAKDDPDAKVLVDGKDAAEEERAAWIEKAYAVWVNDTYWLAMPWKLEDAGVRLELAGEEKSGSAAYDVLALSFDSGTGLTSGDRYRVLVERGGAGLVARWEYVLENQEPPPVVWSWEGWTTVAGVKLSARKVQAGGPREIVFEKLEALPADCDGRFAAVGGGS